MQTAILDLQTLLRSLYRQFRTEGDASTGLNEPDITQLRAAFGTDFINILSRSLLGPVGVEYPEFPDTVMLKDKLPFLVEVNSELQWALIPAADVQRAAELVDFEGQITAEIQSSAAQAIANIQEDAPFNERFDTEADMNANLNFPADAIVLAFDTLRIFKKLGDSGTGSWQAFAAQPLASLPGSASTNDLQAAEARITTLETQLANVSDLASRLNRLDGFHPFEPPVWDNDLPSINGPSGSAITPIDLATYVTDGDSSVLTYAATNLHAGLVLNGSVISGTPSEFGPERQITVTATDENGQQAQAQITALIYDQNAPQPNPPIWTQIPNQDLIVGSSIQPVNYANFLQQSVDDVITISVSVSGQPTGVSLSDKLLSGQTQQVGNFTVRAVATSQSGLTATTFHAIVVRSPPFNGGGGGGGGFQDPDSRFR